MKRFVTVLLSLTIVTLSASSVLAQSNAAAGFEKLKSLAGEWQSQGPHGTTNVSYQLVSGGSAIVETTVPPNEPGMVTLYHLDGDKLIMTHYCSIGNQPRMRAEVPAGEIMNLSFTFVDATNVANASQGHMRHLTFTFRDQDHVTQVWTWRQDGKDMPATFNLERKK